MVKYRYIRIFLAVLVSISISSGVRAQVVLAPNASTQVAVQAGLEPNTLADLADEQVEAYQMKHHNDSTSNTWADRAKLNIKMTKDTVFVMPEHLRAQKTRPKVAVVLCGGGAKGAAHVGVLKVIEEIGIPVDMVVGTSIGGLVGGMYAIGYKADDIQEMFKTMDWKFLLSNVAVRRDASFRAKEDDQIYVLKVPFYGFLQERESMLNSGMVNGQNVFNVLNGYAGGYRDSLRFDQLPKEFACVATDLSSGARVVLREGSLPKAMRATMAIPGFFEAVELDGRVLVDGGVVDNYPVDVAKSLGADIVIGVDISDELYTNDELKSLTNVVQQLISLLGNDTYKQNIEQTNIYIKPDMAGYSTFSFNRQAIDSLIGRGEAAAQYKYKELASLARQLKEYKEEPPMRNNVRTYNAVPIAKDMFYISDIEVNGVKPEHVRWILRRGALLKGVGKHKTNSVPYKQVLTGEDIDKAISRFYGTGAFNSVTYSLKGNDPQYPDTLVINLTPGPANELGLGVRYDTEEAAAVLLHMGIHTKALFGPSLGLTCRLSYNPYIKVNGAYTFQHFSKVNLEYLFKYEDVSIYDSGKITSHLRFNAQRVSLYLSNLYLRDFNMGVGLRYQNYHTDDFLHHELQFEGTNLNFVSAFGKFQFDDRDSKYFPTGGGYVDGMYEFVLGDVGSNEHWFYTFRVRANTTISFTDRLCLTPEISYRMVDKHGSIWIPYCNYVGGAEHGRYIDHQIGFVGINNIEMVEDYVLVGSASLRCRLWRKHYVSALAAWLRTSDVFESMFNTDGRGYGGYGLQYQYSTPLGPIGLTAQYSTFSRNTSLYLSLGYYF